MIASPFATMPFDWRECADRLQAIYGKPRKAKDGRLIFLAPDAGFDGSWHHGSYRVGVYCGSYADNPGAEVAG